MCYGSVQHNNYSSTRASFMKKLQELLEDDYEDIESLDNVDKLSYLLGSRLWESKFDGLLSLVKEYIVKCGKYENINYMIVAQDSVNNSILSLHLGIWQWLKGRGMVSSV